MIEPVLKEHLPVCLDIIKKSYEDTAVAFGMTEENCPYRGRTRLPLSVFEKEFNDGYMMYGYTKDGRIIGFLSMQLKEDTLYIQDIAILPSYQHNGYGGELLRFAKETALDAGCPKLSLGMVHDNIPLREWYQGHGFHTVKLLHFEKVDYTVGIMESEHLK